MGITWRPHGHPTEAAWASHSARMGIPQRPHGHMGIPQRQHRGVRPPSSMELPNPTPNVSIP